MISETFTVIRQQQERSLPPSILLLPSRGEPGIVRDTSGADRLFRTITTVSENSSAPAERWPRSKSWMQPRVSKRCATRPSYRERHGPDAESLPHKKRAARAAPLYLPARLPILRRHLNGEALI